jgi:hypothetical protein
MREYKRDYVDMLANASYIGLLLVPFLVDHPDVWQYTLWAIAGVAIIAWASSIFRYVAISSQPVSKISSSAQGYVELMGKIKFSQNQMLKSPSGESCVWYRLTRYEQKQRANTTRNFFDLLSDDFNAFVWFVFGIADHNWYEKDVEESDLSFLIEDGTGECTVKPKYADFFTKTKRTLFQGLDTKFEEELLLHGEKVYVLGEFKSFGASKVVDAEKEAAILLAEWKVDKDTFHSRFDTNKNGEIELDEWERARRTALKAVREQHSADAVQHEISFPHDDRMFLISTLSPQDLKSKFLGWSYLHLFVMLVALASVMWLKNEMLIKPSKDEVSATESFMINDETQNDDTDTYLNSGESGL